MEDWELASDAVDAIRSSFFKVKNYKYSGSKIDKLREGICMLVIQPLFRELQVRV